MFAAAADDDSNDSTWRTKHHWKGALVDKPNEPKPESAITAFFKQTQQTLISDVNGESLSV